MNYHAATWHHLSIFFLLTYSFFTFGDGGLKQSVLALDNDVVHIVALHALFSVPTCVENITFSADCYLQQEEFFYLVGFGRGDTICSSDIVHAVELLSKKKKFSEISIDIITGTGGIDIHFSLKGIWTFSKVKIRGVFQGKHLFLQCYLMSRGDVFNHSQHALSLVKMKELLVRQGYYNHDVIAHLEYDKKTEEVTVYVTIKRGKSFRFGSVVVELFGQDSSADSKVQKELQKRLSRALLLQKCSKELLNNEAVLLKSYLARKGFLHISIELEERVDIAHARVAVKWKIHFSQKREFVFFGNSFFSKRELLEKMLDFGRSAWLLPASLLAEEILSAYKAKGFWNAEVLTQEEKERSFFVIKEGPRAMIKSVEMNNVQGIDQTFLKKHCFNRLLKNKYYDALLYDEAIALLGALYNREGFLSCVVVSHSFTAGEHENEHALVVTVDEGKKSYVASIAVEDYPELSAQGPLKKFSGPLHKIAFDMNILEEQRAWLAHHFQRLGYLHPRIKPSIELKGQDVFITWIVQLGEKVRFGKTVVVGSSRFPYSLVSRLLAYKQGDLWDQEKIKQTFKSLKDLEIFETINLIPDYADKSEEKPIILKIQLDDPYEVRARAGLELQHVKKYQTFSGLAYKIGGTALMKNPFNAGDQLRLDLDFARSHREVIGRYRRPLFLDIPLVGIIQVYSISYNQPGFVGSTNDIYTLIQNGFFFGIERKTSLFDLGCNGGCEWMKTKIKNSYLQDNLARAINFKPQLIDKMVPFLFIEPTIIFANLDNVLNPTRGLSTLISLKGMLPMERRYKESSFFKLLFEQSCFVPLWSAVAAIRLRFGHIFYRELCAIMPSERFYLGGSHSLRGYEADLAPPLGIFFDEDVEDHVVPRGGRSMLNGNIELRFPVFKKVGGVIFQDFGLLSSDNFADFKQENMLAATGFGVRFYTPLGPLRFDIGWKWKKERLFERSFAWFLTFGQAF